MTKVIDFDSYKNKKKVTSTSDVLIDIGLVIGKFKLFVKELTPDTVEPEYKEIIASSKGSVEDLVALLSFCLDQVGSKDCTIYNGNNDNGGA